MKGKSQGERFVLGVDLDGVIADFYRGFRPIVAAWFDRPLSSLSLTKFEFGLEAWGIKKYGPDEEERHDAYEKIHRFAVMERNLFSNLQPIMGAPKVLRELSDNNIRIRIITHRLYMKYTHETVIQQTVQWLARIIHERAREGFL